ncbi:MAG: hypothetical protein VXW65_11490 [Pseudomonadota bacterium]|nr:hypothetical protein [Pseudomonadota bacterium]
MYRSLFKHRIAYANTLVLVVLTIQSAWAQRMALGSTHQHPSSENSPAPWQASYQSPQALYEQYHQQAGLSQHSTTHYTHREYPHSRHHSPYDSAHHRAPQCAYTPQRGTHAHAQYQHRQPHHQTQINITLPSIHEQHHSESVTVLPSSQPNQTTHYERNTYIIHPPPCRFHP